MNCLICNKPSLYFLLCPEHTPKYGQTVLYKNDAIFVGSIPVLKVMRLKLKGFRIIKWWLGTDARTMKDYVPGMGKFRIFLHRIKMRVMNFLFIDEHWTVAHKLKNYIPWKSTVYHIASQNFKKYPKKDHEGLNVLWYLPLNKKDQEFKDWCYGRDLFNYMKDVFEHHNINFIEVDGRADMSKIYPIIDVYVRANRSDGQMPRMVLECMHNDIPYYYSEFMKPDPEQIKFFIENYYNRKHNYKTTVGRA